MNNKRGFTLVEIIACLSVISLLAVIVLPKISGSNDSKKEEQYNKIIKTVVNAGKMYFLDSNISDNAVTLTTLISNKYMDTAVNPKTNTSLSGCVVRTLSNGVYTYSYTSTCPESITITLDAGEGLIPITSGWTNASDNKTSTRVYISPTSYVVLPVPILADNTFDGWYTESSGGTKVESTQVPGSTTTLYARYNNS